VNVDEILRSKLKGQGRWERKCTKSFFIFYLESIYVKPRPKWSPVHSIQL